MHFEQILPIERADWNGEHAVMLNANINLCSIGYSFHSRQSSAVNDKVDIFDHPILYVRPVFWYVSMMLEVNIICDSRKKDSFDTA